MIVESNASLQPYNTFGIVARARTLVRVKGAADVQNIGAYGVELQDRFESLDAIDLMTGREFTLDATQCAFGYRDSVFKHSPVRDSDFGLAGRALILRVRMRLPKPWKPVLGYLDLQRKLTETGITHPDA